MGVRMATDAEIEAMKRQQGKVQIVSPNATPPPQPTVPQPTVQPVPVYQPPAPPPGGHYQWVKERKRTTEEKLTSGFKEVKNTVVAIKGVKDDIGDLNELFNPAPKWFEQEWVGEVAGEAIGGLMEMVKERANMGKDLENFEIKSAIQQGLIQPRIAKGYQLTEKGRQQMGVQPTQNVNPQNPPQQPQQQPQQQGLQVQEGFLRTATDEDFMNLAKESTQDPEGQKKIFQNLKQAQSNLNVTQVKEAEFTKEAPPQQPPQQPPPQQVPQQDAANLALMAEVERLRGENNELKGQVISNAPAEQRIGPPKINPEILMAIKNKIAEKTHRSKNIDGLEINEKNLSKLNKAELNGIGKLLGRGKITGESNIDTAVELVKIVRSG